MYDYDTFSWCLFCRRLGNASTTGSPPLKFPIPLMDQENSQPFGYRSDFHYGLCGFSKACHFHHVVEVIHAVHRHLNIRQGRFSWHAITVQAVSVRCRRVYSVESSETEIIMLADEAVSIPSHLPLGSDRESNRRDTLVQKVLRDISLLGQLVHGNELLAIALGHNGQAAQGTIGASSYQFHCDLQLAARAPVGDRYNQERRIVM